MIKEFRNEYRFLSNFYPSPITIDNLDYLTVEHFYQSKKALHIRDAEDIRWAATAGDAKRLGRRVRLNPLFESSKYTIMKRALIEKFKIPELKLLLKLTGDQELIEGNYWHDNTWGSCMCQKCANIKGANHLGKLLMEIRTMINKGEI